MLLWLFWIVFPWELLLKVVPPPAELRLLRLLVELKVVPVNLYFYLAVASGVSLLLICLLLLHWVSLAEDLLVVVVVKAAVVAVLSRLLLGHLPPEENVPPALPNIYWLLKPLIAKLVDVAPPVLLLEILELNALLLKILLIMIY